jgi:hypothetical protein
MMKLSLASTQRYAPLNTPQRQGTLHVPERYAEEVETLLHRVAHEVNTLHDSSVHNKLLLAQRLAGARYYKSENAPERQAVNALMPHLNKLKAVVIHTVPEKDNATYNAHELELKLIPAPGVRRTTALMNAGKRLQQHVEGWVSQHARAMGLPHYLASQQK